MSFDSPISFSDAVEDAEGWGTQPSLLLGNGFSMAWDDHRFDYAKLLDGARVDLSEQLQDVFELCDTSNFEAIMQALERTREIARIFGGAHQLRETLKDEIANLRRALIDGIHRHHPLHSYVVTDAQKTTCGEFIRNFHNIFTTNYDLLLYWVINSSADLQRLFTDAFGNSGPRTPLMWSKPVSDQNTHYLHGALHFAMTSKGELEKFQWTGQRNIMDEVEDLLEAGRLPLIVSEGTSERKLQRINSNPYLRRCLRALRRNARPLFVFGFSFGEQDQHITEAIVHSNCPELYVGLHGAGRGRIRDAIDSMIEARKAVRGLPELWVTYFDSDTARVWR